jgi:hypothetical protein
MCLLLLFQNDMVCGILQNHGNIASVLFFCYLNRIYSYQQNLYGETPARDVIRSNMIKNKYFLSQSCEYWTIIKSVYNEREKSLVTGDAEQQKIWHFLDAIWWEVWL